ncbi:MAG: O-antigen ligase family protein [Flavobacteriaceae bacterium]
MSFINNVMVGISVKVRYATFQNLLLWLLLTGGAIKPFFTYFNLPFDYTLLIFLVVVVDILFNMATRFKEIHLNKEKLLILGVLWLFYLAILFSLIYTPSNSFSVEKSYLFSINILFFVYPLFVRELNLVLLYKLFLYILVPIVIWFILFKALYFSPLNSGYNLVDVSFYEIRRNYLGFGMCLSILTILQIHLKKSFLIGALSMVLLLGLGARGALIFLLISLLIWKWRSVVKRVIRFKIKRKMLRTLTVVSILLPVALITQYEKIANFLYLGIIRFQSLFELSADQSVQGRIDRLSFAVENIFGSVSTLLFGNGIGSFGILYSGEDVREYPHNIFLEILFELGSVALILFCVFIFLPFLFKRILVFKVLVIYFLLNALKSGDLTGLWLLFFFIGLLVFNPKVCEEITT